MLSDSVSKFCHWELGKREKTYMYQDPLDSLSQQHCSSRCDSWAHHIAAHLVSILLVVSTHLIRISSVCILLVRVLLVWVLLVRVLLIRVLLIWTILLLIHSSNSHWHTTSTNPAAIAASI
jgi:hypothetical protein